MGLGIPLRISKKIEIPKLGLWNITILRRFFYGKTGENNLAYREKNS